MISDIPASTRQIAQHLKITPRTLKSYIQADQAPRTVMLALFWETQWGRSAADCEAANAAQVATGYAKSLERENATLRRQIAIMESMMADPAANTPFFLVGHENRINACRA